MQKTTPNSTKKNINKALLLIFIGAVVSGAMTTTVKIGLETIPIMTFSFLRMLIASIVILPFFLKEKVDIYKSFRILSPIALLPFFNIIFFAYGIRLTSATIGQTLYATTPLITALILTVFLHKKIGLKKWLFILLGFLGALLIILLPLLNNPATIRATIFGNMLIFIAVIFWSVYTIQSEAYQAHYSPITINAIFTFLATAIFLILSIGEIASMRIWLPSVSVHSIFALMYVAIFGTLGGYLIHQYAIKYGGPVIASLGFYLLPVTAYISAFMLLGEELTLGLIAGCVIIIISVFAEAYIK